jgi:hypothetical protein
VILAREDLSKMLESAEADGRRSAAATAWADEGPIRAAYLTARAKLIGAAIPLADPGATWIRREDADRIVREALSSLAEPRP